MGNGDDTPMMRQYNRIREEHKDAVLFFRMGDFYEMFRNDAVEVSRLLNLTLTKRHGIPMCGIPYHASQNYIGRLLKMGKKIAVCEQTKMPENGKGIAKREVVEIITPGTILDEDYLDKKTNNYLAAIGSYKNIYSLSYIDISTAEFRTSSYSGVKFRDFLMKEMTRIQPHEIIIQESLLENSSFDFLSSGQILVNRYPDWSFDLQTSEERLKAHFQMDSLKGFGFSESDPALLSAGVIIEYLQDTAKNILPHVRNLKSYSEKQFLGMDEATLKNLEIIRNLQDGSSSYTLMEVVDKTKTAMGARNLSRWLLHPLTDKESIIFRQNQVEAIYHDQKLLSDIREILGGILDIERLASRVAMEKAHAKDLVSIGVSLKKGEKLFNRLSESSGLEKLLAGIKKDIKILSSIKELLNKALLEDPSILISEGNIIREGYSEELDRLKEIKNNSKSILDAYLEEEREKTGISNLKIKYNKIIGYFFDVTKSHSGLVPEYFIRRQSLVGSERYTTEKLAERESEINNASDNIIELEKRLFLDIRDKTFKVLDSLQNLSTFLSEIDTYQSMAYAATRQGYIKPGITNPGNPLIIKEGRHPVVEYHLPSGEFVPNSISMDSTRSFALLTGPNMAGKSTYLRQIALICLMAQTGSFIPAAEASISIQDRIFCRVGASDNLARGESTFLVEMNETANILNNASSHSLIIMDEVGRGTGTNDGLAIAWGVCEYLLNVTKAKTLFATHYHELTNMEHPLLFNLSMAVNEANGSITFLKRIKEEPSSNSYGIHVGKLAGLPAPVVRRAREVLSSLEIEKSGAIINNIPSGDQQELFSSNDLVIDEIKGIDPDDLTPRKALDIIYRWKKELG